MVKFCARYKLPLDFISWHAYSTDPKAEKENTRYNKTAAALIRDWLSYFDFEKNTALIVDEWNYDSGVNLLIERQEKSFIAASYIFSRLKNMHEAGIDYQLFFSLEDFYDSKENIIRNLGIFCFKQNGLGQEVKPKAIYNVFKMLGRLGNEMLLPSSKLDDEFASVIATKTQDGFALVVNNYIDPEIFKNYLSRNISLLSDSESRRLLFFIKTGAIEKIINQGLDISALRVNKRVKNLLKKAQGLNDKAKKFSTTTRNIKIALKDLKENYLYSRYTVDSSCGINCDFVRRKRNYRL